MSGIIVARLLRWGRPSVNRPAYSPGSVDVPLGRVVTRLGPDRRPVPVGTVVATRDAPGGLEVTIRLGEGPAGVETAAEVADGYCPGVDIVLQPLANDPVTFKPRSRVHAIGLSTLADPGDEDGRVLSVDGIPLTAPDPAELAPGRPVKPPVIAAAEELLTQAGAGSSWWATVG